MMSFYVCLILGLTVLKVSASLECFSCNDIDSIAKCKRITKCGQLLVSGQSNVVVEVIDGTTISETQSCFTRTKEVGGNTTYTMGCTVNENCGSIPVYAKMSAESPSKKCDECCGTDRCNKDLCKHLKPDPCINDPEFDCAFLNKYFNICESIHQAKRICRNFCKLCDLVDASWAEWSQWSGCDVTCGYGKHTRSRTCTNPAPAYKGLDCDGAGSDTKPCVRQLCPVHGGWTDWADWGGCPVTCGIGIQKRTRNCTNPYPSRYGDHCFGDSFDVKLCRQDSCEADASDSVAFNAYRVTDTSPAKEQTMIFSNILTNSGAAYNKATGVFVAPRNGTYMFTAQLCSGYKKRMHFDIKVGNVPYATAYGYGYGSNDCESAQAVVELTKNDNVYVQWNTWSYVSQSAVAQGTEYRNYFSGSLIHG